MQQIFNPCTVTFLYSAIIIPTTIFKAAAKKNKDKTNKLQVPLFRPDKKYIHRNHQEMYSKTTLKRTNSFYKIQN